ncbi:Alpha-Globin Transcription Factor Cp2 [Manis pentadactyla]|nr:Alpha-Globin Transcription Factor Cp2 [Manis pentadactyla]
MPPSAPRSSFQNRSREDAALQGHERAPPWPQVGPWKAPRNGEVFQRIDSAEGRSKLRRPKGLQGRSAHPGGSCLCGRAGLFAAPEPGGVGIRDAKARRWTHYWDPSVRVAGREGPGCDTPQLRDAGPGLRLHPRPLISQTKSTGPGAQNTKATESSALQPLSPGSLVAAAALVLPSDSV